MKCIRCNELAVYVFRGFSYCKKHAEEHAISEQKAYRDMIKHYE